MISECDSTGKGCHRRQRYLKRPAGTAQLGSGASGAAGKSALMRTPCGGCSSGGGGAIRCRRLLSACGAQRLTRKAGRAAGAVRSASIAGR